MADQRLLELMKGIILPQNTDILSQAVACAEAAELWAKSREALPEPIPMLLWCPECGDRHIDRGEFVTKPHETHACQHCGMVWKPAKVPTVGVQFLPGYHDGTHKIVTRE